MHDHRLLAPCIVTVARVEYYKKYECVCAWKVLWIMLTVDWSASFSKENGTCYSSYPCCLCRCHWRLLRHQSMSALHFRQSSQPTYVTMKLTDCLLAAQTSVVVASPQIDPGPNLRNMDQTETIRFCAVHRVQNNARCCQTLSNMSNRTDDITR